jgi:DNA-binding transcriptional ArsR family regulator
MSRAATTSDVFNAIAEPRRREIIGLLAGGQARSVNDLVEAMGLAQPAVSKRLYSLNASELKAVHDWASQFERFWSVHVDRIKERAERKAAEVAKKN